MSNLGGVGSAGDQVVGVGVFGAPDVRGGRACDEDDDAGDIGESNEADVVDDVEERELISSADGGRT